MLVKELNARLFDNSILEDYLLSAISSPAAAFEQDYERLELLGDNLVLTCTSTAQADLSLGDAYLKYLSTTYVFVISPAQHEGALHAARLRIISNRALLLNGDAAGLPPFIQSKPFVSKLWTPPNYVLEPPPPPTKEKLEERARVQREAIGGGDETAGTAKSMTGSGQAEVKREPSPDPPLPPSNALEASGATSATDPTAATKVDDNASKKLGKRSRKRRLAEQRDIHWLGDKVHFYNQICD